MNSFLCSAEAFCRCFGFFLLCKPSAAPEADVAIPASLLQGVLEAERNQQMRTGGQTLKLPVMNPSEAQREGAELADNPPAASVEAAESAERADDRAPESNLHEELKETSV